jgi:hypothetical protein
MELIEKVIVFLFIILIVPLTATLYFSLEANQNLDNKLASLSKASLSDSVLPVNKLDEETGIIMVEDFSLKLQNPPEIIKAIYLTSWSSGNNKYVNGYLENIFKNTEINAVVIDIKDYTGYVSYNSKAEKVLEYKTYKNIIPDLDNLIRELHKKNIYVIARLSVFEDPALAIARPDLAVFDASLPWPLVKKERLWKDNHGLYWMDPFSKEVQDYNISIAKDALSYGFDEINFDYIRFPSDGKTKNIMFPFWNGTTSRHLVIENFFKRIRQELGDAKLSVDLFGQASISYDDLGIGQIIEDSFDYFDYICPMMYPSHYAKNFIGYENPALYPYEVVKYSTDTALKRQNNYNKLKSLSVYNLEDSGLEEKDIIKIKSKIRPWLQDFNMGAIYTAEMVKEQITATKDALKENYTGYMLWNPSNIYKQGAITKEVISVKE